MGRLRFAEPSEIPENLQFNNQAAEGSGLSVLPEADTSSDDKSTADSEDTAELPDEALESAQQRLYSSDEEAETEVNLSCFTSNLQALQTSHYQRQYCNTVQFTRKVLSLLMGLKDLYLSTILYFLTLMFDRPVSLIEWSLHQHRNSSPCYYWIRKLAMIFQIPGMKTLVANLQLSCHLLEKYTLLWRVSSQTVQLPFVLGNLCNQQSSRTHIKSRYLAAWMYLRNAAWLLLEANFFTLSKCTWWDRQLSGCTEASFLWLWMKRGPSCYIWIRSGSSNFLFSIMYFTCFAAINFCPHLEGVSFSSLIWSAGVAVFAAEDWTNLHKWSCAVNRHEDLTDSCRQDFTATAALAQPQFPATFNEGCACRLNLNQ